jgi:hypothetical protein
MRINPRLDKEIIPEQNAEYEYALNETSPRCSDRPPIHPSEFSDALNYCSTSCNWWMNPWHKCNIESTECLLVSRLPKKKIKWDLDSNDQEIAWGLAFSLEVRFFRVLMWHVLLTASTFIAWGLWMSKHTSDVSGAAVPLTVIIAGISAF